jgi:hypothetical protein
MTDYVTSKIIGHRRNILRYSRLLATHLTDLEREYIHKQIAVEQSKIENLELWLGKLPSRAERGVTRDVCTIAARRQ